jgi:lysyl-tRNA synthetase class 2
MDGRTANGSGWRPRPPLSRAATARIVQLAGLFDIVTAIAPPHRARIIALGEFVPAAGMLSARAGAAVVGMLRVSLGAGLRRGKHRAWQLAVGLAAAGVVLHVAKGLDVDAAVVSAALLGLLVVTRGQFRAIADPRSRWRALGALLGFAAAGWALGFTEIAIRADHLAGAPGVAAWATHAALGLIGVTGPVRFVRPLAAEAVCLTTGAFGLLAAGAATVLLLRPGAPLPRRTSADDDRLRDLLSRHGGHDSLGYFALRPDKALIWARNGQAAIAYRVVHGVCLASGNPVGIPSAWPEAIAAWLELCARHGWTPAVLGCDNAAGKALRRAGLDVIELGDEAVVDTQTFSLDGRPMRSVRQAVTRVRRAGYTCRVVRQRDLTAAELAEAVRAADAYRDGPVERGFSMALSRLGDPGDGDCVLVLARDGDGALRGLLQLVPWGADGLSLDLMRGDRTAGNGLTELMIVTAVEGAPALGVRKLSLNFAVLRSVFARADELGAGPVLRLTRWALHGASRLWQIESLYRSNAKYQPAWQPRYLCFPAARELPRIAVAALAAEAFLPIGFAPRRRAVPEQPPVVTAPAAAMLGGQP